MIKIVLPIILRINDGQNKCEVDKCSQNFAVTFCSLQRPSNVHNLVIFHPILTFLFLNSIFFESNRMVIKIKLYLSWFIIWFLDPIFAPRPHMGGVAHETTRMLFECPQAINPTHIKVVCVIKVVYKS